MSGRSGGCVSALYSSIEDAVEGETTKAQEHAAAELITLHQEEFDALVAKYLDVLLRSVAIRAPTERGEP